jgi:hypothetical protein
MDITFTPVISDKDLGAAFAKKWTNVTLTFGGGDTVEDAPRVPVEPTPMLEQC